MDSWRALSNLTPRCQKFARDRNSDLRPDVGSEIGHLKIGRLNFLMKRTCLNPNLTLFPPVGRPRLFQPLSGEIGCLRTSNRARGLNERTIGRPVSKKTSSVAQKTSYLSLRVNWAISPIPQKLGTGKTPMDKEKTRGQQKIRRAALARGGVGPPPRAPPVFSQNCGSVGPAPVPHLRRAAASDKSPPPPRAGPGYPYKYPYVCKHVYSMIF